MTKFIADVKVIDSDEVVGATVEVKEDVDGDTEVQIVSAERYNELVNDIDDIKNKHVGKKTTTKEMGHVRLYDALDFSVYRDGFALSAQQGKILNDKISAVDQAEKGVKKDLTTHLNKITTTKEMGHVRLYDALDFNGYRDGFALPANQGKILNDKISAVSQRLYEMTAKIKVLDKMQDIILDEGGVIVSSDVSYQKDVSPKTVRFYVFDKNGEPIRNKGDGAIAIIRLSDGKKIQSKHHYSTDDNGVVTRTIELAELKKPDVYMVYIAILGMYDHCFVYVHG